MISWIRKLGSELRAAMKSPQDAPALTPRTAPAPEINPELRHILNPGVLTQWSGLRPAGAYRWLLPQLAAITPLYLENILRGALAGDHFRQWELFSLMEDTWPRLGKNLNRLKGAVRNMTISVTPFAEDDEDPTDMAKEKARLCDTALRLMRAAADNDENTLDGTIYDLLDAWAKGTSILELVYHQVSTAKLGSFWAPRASVWVHPVNYGYDVNGRVGLRNDVSGQMTPGIPSGVTYQTQPNFVAPFPEGKFLVAVRKHATGSMLGAAMLRPLCWWWLASNFAGDWLLNFAQLFGVPFRFANYDPQAPQATIDSICNMLQNMGSNGWAAFPAGTTFELKEAGGKADSSPQADIIDRADKACDLLVLGQTLTSDVGQGKGSGGGSRALGQVHAGVESEIADSMGAFIADILQSQLFPALLKLNYGEDSECPSVTLETQKEDDLTQRAQIVATLAQAGAGKCIPLDWINDTFSIPHPEDGEETLAPAQPAGVSTEKEPGMENEPESSGGVDSRSGGHAEARRRGVGDETHAALARLLSIKDDALFAKSLADYAATLTQP